nr:MAG TPA: hypothetical protein [Bacteriophage sp.]
MSIRQPSFLFCAWFIVTFLTFSRFMRALICFYRW